MEPTETEERGTELKTETKEEEDQPSTSATQSSPAPGQSKKKSRSLRLSWSWRQGKKHKLWIDGVGFLVSEIDFDVISLSLEPFWPGLCVITGVGEDFVFPVVGIFASCGHWVSHTLPFSRVGCLTTSQNCLFFRGRNCYVPLTKPQEIVAAIINSTTYCQPTVCARYHATHLYSPIY